MLRACFDNDRGAGFGRQSWRQIELQHTRNLVGAMISTCGTRVFSLTRINAAMPNAAVLPEPACDWKIRLSYLLGVRTSRVVAQF